MINKYRNANKDLKEYKVSKVRTGTTKNGNPFTVFVIADSQVVNGTRIYDNYSVFCWETLDLKDGDKIQLVDITALEVKQEEWQGKPQIKKTIFADVVVIPAEGSTGTNNVPADLIPIDDGSELPF